MPVSQYLDLNVAGIADVALQENSIVAESGAGLLPGLFNARGEILRFVDHAHAPATAAEGCLDDQRVSDFVGDPRGSGKIGHGFRGAWNHENPRLGGQISGGGFVAEQFEQAGAGTDEGDARAFAG